MPWDEFSRPRLARARDRDPAWIARRLLAIGLERGLVSRNAADVLVVLGAGPDAVLRELVAGMGRDGEISGERARRWLDQA